MTGPLPHAVQLAATDIPARPSEASPIPFSGDAFGAPEDYTEDDFPMDHGGGQDFPRPEVNLQQDHGVVQEESDDDYDNDELQKLEAVARDILQPPAFGFSEDVQVEVSGPSESGNLSEVDLAAIASEPDGTDSVPHNAPDEGSVPDSSNAEPTAPVVPGGGAAEAHEALRAEPSYIQHFGGAAGAPINNSMPQSGYHAYGQRLEDQSDNPYAPFRSKVDWEIAEWAQKQSASSNVFSIRKMSWTYGYTWA